MPSRHRHPLQPGHRRTRNNSSYDCAAIPALTPQPGYGHWQRSASTEPATNQKTRLKSHASASVRTLPYYRIFCRLDPLDVRGE